MRNIAIFPVRRFQVDPQATRLALRLLQGGAAVAIYIEGERSWNGQLQEPRPGTIRLALRAGAPIILCVVSGSYQVWPRWDRRPRPGPVRIRFLPPVHFEPLRGQANRDATAEATERIMSSIRATLEEPA
jgi:1-acyl-sn-glycerol-3-phosphate acyltransferase